MKLPQFTLRDLFWLVALAAMAAAWWVDHARLEARIAFLDKMLSEMSH